VTRPVIRFSSWVKGSSVLIKFKTLEAYESQLMDLIEGAEKYLAPDSLTIVEGRRERPWLYVIVEVNGYEKMYVEHIIREVAWAKGLHPIKVMDAEIAVD
jgi:hypothetical protein